MDFSAVSLLFPHAVALTIAGSDPSGGAGLQADLKTFQQLGVFGMSAVTLLTVQNTQAVTQVQTLSPQWVVDQIRAVVTDIPPSAIKVGALGTAAMVRAVAEELSGLCGSHGVPLIVDPVLVSKHGHALVDPNESESAVVNAYREHLLPLATMVTPNRFEALKLGGPAGSTLRPEAIGAADFQTWAAAILRLGPRAVLLKAGGVDGHSLHIFGQSQDVIGQSRDFIGQSQDVIGQSRAASLPNRSQRLTASDAAADFTFTVWDTPRLEASVDRPHTANTHGSGCVLAAAIAARLACGEVDLLAAARFGVAKTLQAITSPIALGQGIPPADPRAISTEFA